MPVIAKQYLSFMEKSTINSAIVDDEACACERLNDLLTPFQYIQVKGVFRTFDSAVGFLLEEKPALVFLDVELDKNHTAFELIDYLHANLYKPYIILITAYEHYSIRAIRKGIFDYLVKPIDIEELKDTINRLERILFTPLPELTLGKTPLSNRELEVLDMVLEGKTSSQISKELFVSKSTIDTHRKNILRKTGVNSMLELMRMARI